MRGQAEAARRNPRGGDPVTVAPDPSDGSSEPLTEPTRTGRTRPAQGRPKHRGQEAERTRPKTHEPPHRGDTNTVVHGPSDPADRSSEPLTDSGPPRHSPSPATTSAHLSFGSRASRTASPSMMKARTVIARAPAGHRSMWGALRM